eukprot:gene5599-7728_t
MSITTESSNSFLPNLPGYRSREIKKGPKKSFFKLVNGQVIQKEDYLPPLGSSGEDDGGSLASVGSPSKTKRLYLDDIGKILNFQAYFEELPDNGDPVRIRKCNIYFYLEDKTLKVVEKPQINSGVSQGTLVRKSEINKPSGLPFSPEDFQIGSQVVIYGRTYKIVDCDAATRNYLKNSLNIDLTNSGEVPIDSYQTYRSSLQAGPSDDWSKYHNKKNDNKTYIEALLGHSVDNKGREGFNRFGNKTVKFRCVWDNTANLYGDVLEFCLSYYLSDDTIEVISIANSSVPGITKLLKRSKLPKQFFGLLGVGERYDENSFFHWSDIYIGLDIDVYGRTLRVIDADPTTRDFYENVDMPLDPAIILPTPVVVVHKREIPPPTNFGSEEDSLRSCAGPLMPGPAPAKKLGENKVLAFFATLKSGGIDDKGRRFVVSYYLVDQTIKITEPPIRNSGFTGGVFLSRREIKNTDGELITEKDLFVGTDVRILKHIFHLYDANEATFRWMEDKGLPRSSFYVILDKIRPYAIEHATNGILTSLFQQEEPSPGQATIDTFRNVLMKYNLIGNSYYDVSEHELRTILRANGNRSNTFSYVKLIEQILQPTDEFK